MRSANELKWNEMNISWVMFRIYLALLYNWLVVGG